MKITLFWAVEAYVVDTVCQGDLLFPARPHGVTLQKTVTSTIIYAI